MAVMFFILVWLISVVCMTMFSALWSKISGHQFREPALLSQLLDNANRKAKSLKQSHVLGWLIHFMLGVLFLGFYEVLWRLTNVERTLIWGFVFGSVLGVLGILGWKILFKTVGFSSDFNYRQYYIHIYFAHLVFSLTALVVFYFFY